MSAGWTAGPRAGLDVVDEKEPSFQPGI